MKGTFYFDFSTLFSTPAVKSHIISKLKEECEQYLGSAMTYTIFEYLRDNSEELLSSQPEVLVAQVDKTLQTLVSLRFCEVLWFKFLLVWYKESNTPFFYGVCIKNVGIIIY